MTAVPKCGCCQKVTFDLAGVTVCPGCDLVGYWPRFQLAAARPFDGAIDAADIFGPDDDDMAGR